MTQTHPHKSLRSCPLWQKPTSIVVHRSRRHVVSQAQKTTASANLASLLDTESYSEQDLKRAVDDFISENAASTSKLAEKSLQSQGTWKARIFAYFHTTKVTY